MEHYAPAYFVIDRQHEILRFSGSEARHYLEPSPGAANLNLFSLLQKTLRPAVRAAVEQAFATERTVINEDLTIQIDGKSRPLTLIVEPVPERWRQKPRSLRGCLPRRLAAGRDRSADPISND